MEGLGHLGHKKTGSSSPLPVASVAHSGLTFVKLDGHNRVDVPHSKARTRIPLTEDALCGLFAETAAESRAFREWVLGHTKFRSHAHTARLMREEQIQKRPHVRPERWWRHWWCTIPGLQEQRETDIFLVFQTDDTNRRFALLVENKKRARFSPGQAAAYNAKARFMSGKAEYLHFTDFQTMVIAPAAFHEAHATECDKFDVYISYEAIGAYIPQFAQL